jgi:hypothetical protein
MLVCPRLSSSNGQASVELVALLPLVALVGLAIFSALTVAAAGEVASQAAEAGAVALLQDRDPAAAAREAVPDGARARTVIRIDGRRVHVEVRPRLPFAALEDRFAARASADAGPEPRP